jgi:hypothetical protein
VHHESRLDSPRFAPEVNGALALIIAGQDERVRLGIEALATHNDEFPPHDRSEAW